MLRSTPGNNTSTESAMPDALSLACVIQGGQRLYVPGARSSSIVALSCSLSSLR